jgi:sugar (glycoside-pentoside-hexuronide) transporter
MAVQQEALAAASRDSEKLTFWQKLGYGFGDIYGGGSGVIVNLYYLHFLTDVVRLRPQLAGTVILISKIYDSITDPFEGVIADRTRTSWGRRRPYLMAGVLLVFLSFAGLYYPVTFDREGARFAAVVASYLLFSTVVSIVLLNYNALQSELTLDYNERTALSSFRMVFSTIGSVLAASLPLEIVGQFADVRAGWRAMALIFGAIFALPYVATVIATRERPDFQSRPHPFNWHKVFVEPLKMRSFVYVLGMYLFAFVAMDILANVVIFYLKNYLGREGETRWVITLVLAQVVSLPLFVQLAQRTSKRTSYMVAGFAWMILMVGSLLITPSTGTLPLYTFIALVGSAIGGISVSIYAIFPDIPDIDELQSGERREGIYAAMFTFARKISSALAIFLVAHVIGFAGYIPPAEVIVEGATRLIEQPQSAGFLLALRLTFALLPILMMSAALAFASHYRLSSEVHARLKRVLARRRSGGPETEVDRAEAEALKELLL